MACIVGMMFFASCTQEQIDDLLEQKPEVAFVAGEGLTAASTNVEVGAELKFQVKFAPNSGSESPLANFNFAITKDDGTTVVDVNPEFTASAENTFEKTYKFETAANYIITATVTDEAGKVNVATMNIACVEPVVEGLGTFVGDLGVHGHVVSEQIIEGQEIDQDYDFRDTITLVLGALDAENRVQGTLYIGGPHETQTPVAIQGTLQGDVITFDEFHFNKTLNLITDVIVDLKMQMTGTFSNEGTMLRFEGTTEGQGDANFITFVFTVTMTGDVDGFGEKQ